MSSFLTYKALKSFALASRIERSGKEIAPYSFCYYYNKCYITINFESSCYAKCIRYYYTKCNLSSRLPTLDDQASLNK